MDEFIIANLNGNNSVEKSIGKVVDLRSLLQSENDITWLDSMIMPGSHNLFSKDSMYPKIMMAMVKEKSNKRHSEVRTIQQKLDSLRPAVEVKMKSKKFLFFKSRDFNIFRSKDETGDTNKLISKYTSAWYRFIDDLSIAREESQAELESYLDHKAEVIDYSLLNITINLGAASDARQTSQSEKDAYEASLVARLGQREVDRIKKQAEAKLTSYARYVTSSAYQSGSDPRVRLNPFISGGKLNGQKDDFVTIIPKKGEEIVYIDKSFSDIESDQDLYSYWEAMELATNYINFAFSDNAVKMNYNELPSVSKTFTEEVITNGIKGVPTFLKDKVKLIFTSKHKEEMRAFDSNDLNRVYNPLSNKVAKEEYQFMAATWSLMKTNRSHINLVRGYRGNELSVANIGSDRALNFIGDLYGIYDSKTQVKNSDLMKFGRTYPGDTRIFLDIDTQLEIKSSKVAQANESNDIPRVLATVLVQAADYKARQEIHPLLNEMRNQYNKIERNGARRSANPLDRISGKLDSEDDTKRANAVKKMNFIFDKVVKRKFDLLMWGQFKGLKEDDSYFADKKRRTSIWHAIMGGKVFLGDGKKIYNKHTKLINELEAAGKSSLAKDLIATRNTIAHDVTARALINSIYGAIIFRSLAYNLGSGLTNRMEGYLSGMIEDATGRYWSKGNFFEANRFVTMHNIHKLRRSKGHKENWDIFKSMMQNYRLIMDASNEMQKNATRSSLGDMSSLNPFYLSINSVELKNQGSNVLAIMMDKTITSADGKTTVPIFDGKTFPAFEMKDSVFQLKPEFRDLAGKNEADWVTGSSKEFNVFKNKTESVLVQLHGDFSEFGGMRIKNNDLGKGFMLFKTWVPMALWNRLATEQKMIDSEKTVKGRWRSHTKLSASMMGSMAGMVAFGPIGAAIGVAGAVVFANSVGARNTLEMNRLSNVLMESAIHFKEAAFAIARYSTFHMFNKEATGKFSYNGMLKEELDISNMHSNLREMLGTLSMMSVLLIIRNLGFDDDEYSDKGKKLPAEYSSEMSQASWTFLSNEASNLMEASVAFLNPKYYWQMVEGGPVVSYAERIYEFAEALGQASAGDIIETGKQFTGKNKVWTTGANLLLPGPFRPSSLPKSHSYDARWMSSKIFHHLVDYDIVGSNEEHPIMEFMKPQRIKDQEQLKVQMKQAQQILSDMGYSAAEVKVIMKKVQDNRTGDIKQNFNYKKALKSPQWQKFRKRQINKAGHKCSNCSRTEKSAGHLEVNHITYRDYTLPWKYPDRDVEVLCRNCHQHFHDKEDLGQFNYALRNRTWANYLNAKDKKRIKKNKIKADKSAATKLKNKRLQKK